MKKTIIVMIGLCLLLSLGAFAQGTKNVTKGTTQKVVTPTAKQATGTIVSADASSLVISHKVAGKNENMTFVLNAATKKDGVPAKDGKATVRYTVSGKDDVAISVKATPPPAALAKTNTKKK